MSMVCYQCGKKDVSALWDERFFVCKECYEKLDAKERKSIKDDTYF